MERFILRFGGGGAAPESDLATIRDAPGVAVVDASSPRMVLVEASGETIRDLVAKLPRWTHTPERIIPLPDTRKTIRSN